MGLTFNLGRVSPSVFTDSSLNVGIGAAPSGSYKLEVTGTAKVSSTLLVSGSVTSDDLILTAGTLFGAGNTGFSNRSSDTTLYLQMPATGFNITDNALNTRFILSSAGAATFSSSVTAGSLIVNQASTAADIILKFAINGTPKWLVGLTNDVVDDNFTIYQDGAGGGNRFTINTSGYVGIGTSSPARKLDVLADAIKLGDTGSFLFDMNVGASSAYFINFGIGATNFLRLRGDGYVNLPTTYNNTTATGANLAISTSGFIERSTSSIRFKTEVEDLTIDTSKILSKMRPIWYRSLGQNDRKDWSWYGFIAEEMAEIEPRLVHWGKDENDNNIADGVQYERISVLLVAEMQKMNKLVQELSAQNQDLKSRLDKAGL